MFATLIDRCRHEHLDALRRSNPPDLLGANFQRKSVKTLLLSKGWYRIWRRRKSPQLPKKDSGPTDLRLPHHHPDGQHDYNDRDELE